MNRLTEQQLAELEAMEKAATPGPWWWTDYGIVAGRRTAVDNYVVLYPSNRVDPAHLDPPLAPDETGPRYWASQLGSCGQVSELRAHFDGPLFVEARNALPALIATARREAEQAGDIEVLHRMAKTMTAQITTLTADLATARAERDELKRLRLEDNKAYGCELRDPNGTIWQEAKRLQEELSAVNYSDAVLNAAKQHIAIIESRLERAEKVVTEALRHPHTGRLGAAIKEYLDTSTPPSPQPPDERDAVIRTLIAEVDAWRNGTNPSKARAATNALDLSEYRKEKA